MLAHTIDQAAPSEPARLFTRQQWPVRAVGAFALASLAVAVVLHFLPEESALLAALKLVSACAALVVAPGLVLVGLFGHSRRWDALGLMCIVAVASIGLVQFPTMVTMGLGLPLYGVMPAALSLVVLGAVWLCLAPPSRCLNVVWFRGDGIVLASLAALAVLLYLKGSPYSSDEEQMHIGVIRRLAVVASPSAENIYYAPGIVFVHPFPGTHYGMAAFSWLGGIDALFVYTKLRALWAVLAGLFVFRIAHMVFQRRDLALASFAAACLFALNGTFADLMALYSSQLVPYSHPSDLAMGILLPALLVVALSFLRSRKADWFLLGLTALMLFMLTLSHVREAIQVLVYFASFVIACLLYRRFIRHTWRGVVVVLLGVVILGAYGTWHKAHVAHVAEFNAANKEKVIGVLKTTRKRDLLYGPPVVHTMYDLTYYSWHPWIILLSPLALLAMWRRPFVLLVCGSIFAYLLLIRVPLLSHVMVLATYWEVLMTPARNFFPFDYVLAGPIVYLLVAQLTRLPNYVGWAVALTLGAGMGLATWRSHAFWTAHQDWFFGPALALNAVALAATLWPGVRDWFAPRKAPVLLFGLALLAATLVSAMPKYSPLKLKAISTRSEFFEPRSSIVLTPGQLLESLHPVRVDAVRINVIHGEDGPLDIRLSNVKAELPPPALVHWMRSEVSPESILAVSNHNPFALPLFTPQRINAWPSTLGHNFVYYGKLFPKMEAHYCRSHTAHGVQPFFNDVQSAEERAQFLADHQATHVVVDPNTRAAVHDILCRDGCEYRLLYDADGWSVFEVVAPSQREALTRR
jgi:hypothetical protein